MTIGQAIFEADNTAQNDIDRELKVAWLSRLDRQIATRILNTHHGCEVGAFAGYGDDADPETELLATGPFEELYVDFLVMRIYLHQNEIDEYNNRALVYAESARRFENHVAKTYPAYFVRELRF